MLLLKQGCEVESVETQKTKANVVGWLVLRPHSTALHSFPQPKLHAIPLFSI
jgi:hypothetical protein